MAGGRVETELKFLVRRADAVGAISAPGVTAHEIVQVYLDASVVARYGNRVGLPPEDFEEWRLRRLDDRHIFTAKGGTGMSRREYERQIDGELYGELLAATEAAGPTPLVRKTRYLVPAGAWTAEIDEYHETGAGVGEFDFMTCEVEFGDEAAALGFLEVGAGNALPLLERAVNLTGHAAFANRSLARRGFPVDDFDGLVAWLGAATA